MLNGLNLALPQAKNRWVCHSKRRFTKADTSSASNISSNKDPASTTLETNVVAYNVTLEEIVMPSSTAAAKERTVPPGPLLL